jgi:type I restriction-modification system DNA methylase subunit
MPTYTCEKCAHVFKQKSQYDNHMKRKTDCSKNTKLKEVIQIAVKETIASQSKADITKETLPSFFEALHNLLWNKAGLNPERALEHMTFFFAYRLIEQQADALMLPQECRWSYIASLKNENDLFETIKKGVSSFRSKPITKPFFKPHELQKADIVYEIVRQINRISISILQETDTLGDIFEYMLGRGMSTMSDEGQYFTNRAICKLAFKLAFQIKKKVRREDGSLCTFADWFCGTGGFPAEYVKGVKENTIVDWSVDSESIYCQDMNTSSITTTLLNMLILTGIPFGKKIRSSNSFSDSIILGGPFPDLSIDYCFMNPPYGGDKLKGKEYKFAYSKKVDGEKRYFVNKEIQSIGIEDDDKVSAGVQLAMATLSPNGVCCIVLPQGFFFGASKKYVELRKKIAEEYKIQYIVDIAPGSFLNTGTKTSMMVFQKKDVTDKVSFIGIDETLLVETTLEELRKKQYSFNYKQYLPQTIVEIEGFEMVRLDELVTINTGKNKTPDDKKGTLYPYYGTSEITGYTDHYLEDGEYILTARNGTIGNTFLIEGKSYPSDHMFVLRTNHRCNLKYLYYWMISNKNVMGNLSNVTTIPGITRASLVEIKIPLPSLERQQHIVESIDGWSCLLHQEESSLKLLEKQMIFYVKEMGWGQPCVKLCDICQFISGYAFKSELFTTNVQDLRVVKIKNIKDQKVILDDSDDRYTYVDHLEKYIIKNGEFVIAMTGATTGKVGIHVSDEKVLLNQRVGKFVKFKENVLPQYVYYCIMDNPILFMNLACGTARDNISPDQILSIQIPLPPLSEQQRLQEDFDEIKHKHKKIAIYKAKAQEAIQRLIPTM